MSTLARPSTPSRPNSEEAPRLSHTMDELTTAPSSMVLNGYTLTSGPSVASWPDLDLVADHDAFVDAHVRPQVGALPHDRAPQAAAGPDVHAVEQHAPVELDVGQHPAVRAEHRVLAQAGTRLDRAVGADERRADRLDVRGDLGALPHPDAVGHLEAGDVELDHLVQRVLVHPQVGVERADVLPVPLRSPRRTAAGPRAGAPGRPRPRSRPGRRDRSARRSRARGRRCPC